MPGQGKDNFIQKTKIPGLLVIKRPVFQDNRGFFHEIGRLSDLEAMGVDFQPVQISHSQSLPRVIRAIHTENWQKLIYPVTGKMFAAIVDVRPESPTFGQHETFIFDNMQADSPHMALFLPAGLGNSTCVVGDTPVDYIYAVDEYWDNAKAQGIAWDDPDLGIDWPIKDPIISDRDRQNSSLRQLFPEKFK
jgi:dTDP-4-dehydrorhamnose 3,5-epimerase